MIVSILVFFMMFFVGTGIGMPIGMIFNLFSNEGNAEFLTILGANFGFLGYWIIAFIYLSLVVHRDAPFGIVIGAGHFIRERPRAVPYIHAISSFIRSSMWDSANHTVS